MIDCLIDCLLACYAGWDCACSSMIASLRLNQSHTQYHTLHTPTMHRSHDPTITPCPPMPTLVSTPPSTSPHPRPSPPGLAQARSQELLAALPDPAAPAPFFAPPFLDAAPAPALPLAAAPPFLAALSAAGAAAAPALPLVAAPFLVVLPAMLGILCVRMLGMIDASDGSRKIRGRCPRFVFRGWSQPVCAGSLGRDTVRSPIVPLRHLIWRFIPADPLLYLVPIDQFPILIINLCQLWQPRLQIHVDLWPRMVPSVHGLAAMESLECQVSEHWTC